jgi:hypothetical protein
VLAGEADEADIRAKTDYFPLESTTRMCFAHFYNVTDGYFSKHKAIIHLQPLPAETANKKQITALNIHVFWLSRYFNI